MFTMKLRRISYILQAWNRYSPLPPPPTSNRSPSPGTSPAVAPRPVVPSPVSSSDDRAPVKTADDRLYDQLSNEAQATVDNLVSMGFPKPRVARAVQSLGSDEKEVSISAFLSILMKEKCHNKILIFFSHFACNFLHSRASNSFYRPSSKKSL